MFVGHGLLAFALAGWAADALGCARERALTVGVLAGAFGLAPDVDVAYAPVTLASRLSASPEAFWAGANVVHRTVTHSVLVAGLAAVAVGLWVAGGRRTDGVDRADGMGARLGPLRTAALALTAALVGGVFLVSGTLAAVVLALFLAVVVALGTAGRRLGLGPRAVTGAALVGLLSHPLGDVFTGSPPELLYPLDAPVLTGRLVLHQDPTLHLLGAFGLELATAWLAVLVYLHLGGYGVDDLREYVGGRAGAGLGYAAVAPALPAPTLSVSYQFVFSVLALGVVVALASRDVPRSPTRTVVTGLAAVTLAALAYTAVYVGL